MRKHKRARSGPPRDWQVIDKDVENAFVLPGGHIFVYTGMLKAFQSNHELAAVLGHEMAHVLARHTAERLSWHLVPAAVRLGPGRLRRGLCKWSKIHPGLLHVGCSLEAYSASPPLSPASPSR